MFMYISDLLFMYDLVR